MIIKTCKLSFVIISFLSPFIKSYSSEKQNPTNPIGWAISQLATDKERETVSYAMMYLKSLGYKISTLIHDGFLVQDLNVKEEHLRDAEARVFEATGFRIELVCKPLNNFNREEVFGPERESVLIGFSFDGKSREAMMRVKLIDMLLSNSTAGLIDLNLVQQQKVLGAGATIYDMNDFLIHNLVGNPKEGQSLEEVKELLLAEVENIKKGVFSGETLTDLFNKEKIFPPTFSQLISVGEQTGSLDEMFGSVAIYYEEEFDVAVANLASLIEPIMIVFMGITIGGLMLAMYAPIFNVGAIIG